MSKIVMHVMESSATGTLEIARLMVKCSESIGYMNIVVFSRRKETPQDFKLLFGEKTIFIEVNMHNFHALTSCIKIRKIVNYYAPSHIHLHSSVAGFIGRVSLLLSKHGKIIYSPHCISFLRKDIGFIKKLLFLFLERTANLKPAVYLACSRSEGNQIISRIPNSAVYTLENAIDSSEILAFRKQPSETKRKTISIVTTGGIRTQKHPDQFASIAKTFSHSNWSFTWIGDGDNTYRKRLEEAGVEVTGWLPRNEVLRSLANADIYLSTSRWEGMPVSVIEAACIGLKLIISNIDGHTDIIKDETTGILFNTSEEAIAAILRSENIKDSTKTQAHMIERFSHKTFCSHLQSVYDSA